MCVCVFFSHLNSLELDLFLPGLCFIHKEGPLQLSRHQVVHVSPLGVSCVFGSHGGYLRIKLEITLFWCSLVSCLVELLLGHLVVPLKLFLKAGHHVGAVYLHLPSDLKWAVGIL